MEKDFYFYFPVLFPEILFQLRLWVGFGAHENQCLLSIHIYIQEILTCYLSGTCENKENCGLEKYSQSNSWQFSSVMSNSLWPHGPQHVRPPCLSPTPRVYSNSSPLSRWYHPTISSSVVPFSSCLQSSIFPSIRVFSNESALRIRCPKYWSFSFNISPSNEHSGLISFRMDWFDVLAVQGTLKSLLQHHSSKASQLCFIQWEFLGLWAGETASQVTLRELLQGCEWGTKVI